MFCGVGLDAAATGGASGLIWSFYEVVRADVVGADGGFRGAVAAVATLGC